MVSGHSRNHNNKGKISIRYVTIHTNRSVESRCVEQKLPRSRLSLSPGTKDSRSHRVLDGPLQKLCRYRPGVWNRGLSFRGPPTLHPGLTPYT